MNFLFILDQNLKKIPENLNANDYMSTMIKKIIKSLKKIAPEKEFETSNSPKSASWITNEIKSAIVERDKMFQRLIAEPTIENQTRYKQIRNKVTNLIRNGKRDNNFKKLGKNPKPKIFYRTLKKLAKEKTMPSIYQILMT